MKPSPKRIKKGEYWDEAWTLTRGCTHVSAGCDHCWSERMSHMRRLNPNRKVRDQYGMTDDCGRWTGKVEPLWQNLDVPMRRKKPTVYAIWNDLFHEDVPWNFIFDVFKRMAFCPQHTFMILTKRAALISHTLTDVAIHIIRNFPDKPWPLPNVWLGTTVEDQKQADIRLPHLLRTPAAVRFVSHEPALGMVMWPDEFLALGNRALIITGGETGPGARPMHPDIPRTDRDQCVEAGVKFWFKQQGEYGPQSMSITTGEPIYRTFESKMEWINKAHTWMRKGDICIDAAGKMLKRGGDFDTATFPVTIMGRVGTKRAGRLLDGLIWNEWPEEK